MIFSGKEYEYEKEMKEGREGEAEREPTIKKANLQPNQPKSSKSDSKPMDVSQEAASAGILASYFPDNSGSDSAQGPLRPFFFSVLFPLS